MRHFCLLAFLIVAAINTSAQALLKHSRRATKWVDSVYLSLTPDQRIAQLMTVRESSMDGNNQPVIFADSVKDAIKKYDIGAICLFQGDAAVQAGYINEFQQLAPTPLMVCIDGETGLGMRMEDVEKIPDQLTLGAMRGADKFVYKIGRAIGGQCRRAGINVDYAPVVDINNNPKNPVIGYRSFGEDKYVVANYGVAIMKGMQSRAVMACAKHFPGHGDVDVDSHLDLPVIHKSLRGLDTLELYPFKKMFKAGVGSVMIAHLSIPAIDSTPHQASSLSPKFVTDLLRKKIGFEGISFTDALEMKGVAKYFPQGEIAVKSLEAGNDMLCLPADIGLSIRQIRLALNDGRLSWNNLENRIRKVLYVKYNLGLNRRSGIDTAGIAADLNKDIKNIRTEVARKSLTAVALENHHFSPLNKQQTIAYIAIGEKKNNSIADSMRQQLNATVFNFSYKMSGDEAQNLLKELKNGHYNKVVVGIHHFSKRPANHFDMSDASFDLMNGVIKSYPSAIAVVFGNPYLIADAAEGYKNIIACYEDDAVFEQNAFDFLTGKTFAEGRLPVSVSASLPYGTGILVKAGE